MWWTIQPLKQRQTINVPKPLRPCADRSANAAAGEPGDGLSVEPLSLTRRIVMDWNRVEGNWKQVKGKVKEQWGKLTDDDLDVINGKQINSKAGCNSAMATPRIRRQRK
jgi:uncharacterized protein YjbJ (UPF0337 family)